MPVKKKPKLFYALLVILGLVVGFFVVPFVHEAGHYTIACAYNCSAIREFVYQPQVSFQQLLPTGNFSGYEVRYAGPIKSIYGSYGILVYLGGFLFEMALFATIILLLMKYSKDAKSPGTLNTLLFLLGFYAVFINSTFTWMSDFIAILKFYLGFGLIGIYAVVLPLFAVIYLIWYMFLMRSVKAMVKSVAGKKKGLRIV